MLILTTTTDTLSVHLGGAPVSQLPVVTSYRTVNSTNYTPGRTTTLTDGTTPVSAVPSPSLGDQVVVDFVSVFNPNAANVVVTVEINVLGTPYVLHLTTLAQNERVEYQDGRGWAVYSSSGAIKTSLNQGTNSVSTGSSQAILGSNVVNNNSVANTIQDVTGLSFPVVSGQRYAFEFYIRYTSAATTTGSRWTINGPTTTELTYESQYSLTSTSLTFNTGLTAYDLPSTANASSAATAGNLALIRGILRPSADGTVIARFASEIASSAVTALAGSYVNYSTL